MFTPGTAWQVADCKLWQLDLLVRYIQLPRRFFLFIEGIRKGLSCLISCGIGLIDGDRECWHDRVGEVILLSVIAEELGALYVKQRAVKELEPFGRVASSLRQTWIFRISPAMLNGVG
jgi:hypothetical protein